MLSLPDGAGPGPRVPCVVLAHRFTAIKELMRRIVGGTASLPLTTWISSVGRAVGRRDRSGGTFAAIRS